VTICENLWLNNYPFLLQIASSAFVLLKLRGIRICLRREEFLLAF